MTALGLLVAFVILVGVAVLALFYGVDTRPNVSDRRDAWFGRRC